MKLKRKHKIYLLIFAVSLAVFVIAGEPPEEGSADTHAGGSAKAKSGGKKRRKNPASEFMETHSLPASDVLAERIREISSDRGMQIKDVKDAFGSVQDWFPKPKLEKLQKPRRSQQPQESASDRTAEFKKKYRLTAVIIRPDKAQAIINGKCLTIGEELDGFKLISADARTAVLVSGEVQVVLKLYPSGKERNADDE